LVICIQRRLRTIHLVHKLNSLFLSKVLTVFVGIVENFFYNSSFYDFNPIVLEVYLRQIMFLRLDLL